MRPPRHRADAEARGDALGRLPLTDAGKYLALSFRQDRLSVAIATFETVTTLANEQATAGRAELDGREQILLGRAVSQTRHSRLQQHHSAAACGLASQDNDPYVGRQHPGWPDGLIDDRNPSPIAGHGIFEVGSHEPSCEGAHAWGLAENLCKAMRLHRVKMTEDDPDEVEPIHDGVGYVDGRVASCEARVNPDETQSWLVARHLCTAQALS